MTDTLRRVFLPATPAPGDRVDLSPDESHHVARVLRLASGDALAVFDGRGGEWAATIEACSRERVSVVIGRERAGVVEAALRVVLFQAVTRPERVEWVLQKGTEIGVSAFRLVGTDRVDGPPPSPARMSRYERIVMEACKQSGRRSLPTVTEGPIDTPPQGVVAIVLVPDLGQPPLGSLLRQPKPSEVWLAVGPEGGFSEREVAAATSSGWRPASLGPRIMRTETAGAVAAAIVLHTWGDLGAV